MRQRFILLSTIWFGVAAGAYSPAAELVVKADPRDPAEEAKSFHLPPGFEAQLVASEPQIHKPINIAFDDKGRLWVTDTVEYPFPVGEGKPSRDTVKILSDFGADGHAKSISTFADNLNIPIGVLPQRTPDGHDSALVYSIPGVQRFTDSTGAGKADQRSLMFTGYGHDDTHGMTGSFVEGFDGWIYAVHGFKNASHVQAKDGSFVDMQSGNTYRFRPDGSHIEMNTHGQVNPFGMCMDSFGNLYTSDCETMPILLALRGAYYSSFGKPHDGLGFGPDMTDHMYGSSAIAGLAIYAAEQYPPEFRNMMLVGNVVTNIVNRAQLSPQGSAYHGDDAPNFLVSDDHWFRPVCIKLGPDGALYIADFYNRIIGHYEVDLHHPGRDKERGRIWRIVYTGKDAVLAPSKPLDLTRATDAQLLAYLSDSNLTIRMLTMNYIADCRPGVGSLLTAAIEKTDSPAALKAHGIWILKRLGQLPDATLARLAADASPLVRVHAMRVLSETPKWTLAQRALALAGLEDADAMARRCAADAFGQHTAFENVAPLLKAMQAASPADHHLTHTIRMALRNQLNNESVADKLAVASLNQKDSATLVDVAAGATSSGATNLLVQQIVANGQDPKALVSAYRHVGRYGTDANAETLSAHAAESFRADLATQATLFTALQDGVAQRGGKLGGASRSWGQALATKLIKSPANPFGDWKRRPVEGSTFTHDTWAIEQRKCADRIVAPFISSLPLGEKNTGSIRSADFTIPAEITFYIAGHNGVPSSNDEEKNYVCLRAADNNEILARALPPRNDVAKKVTWDLTKFVGKRGYFEATDGDDNTAYAWLAFGRFEPAVVTIPSNVLQSQTKTAIEIAAVLKVTELESTIAEVLRSSDSDSDTRIAAAKALPELNPDPSAHAPELAAIVRDNRLPSQLRDAAATALAKDSSPATLAAFVEAINTGSQRVQASFAKILVGSKPGATALLDAIAAGKASARLLQDSNIIERLRVSAPENLDARVAELTKNLPAADLAVETLIKDRSRYFDPKKASKDRGQKVFQTNCAVCHSVGGIGAHVGPQLDGIGTRGLSRLCEDVLDPSRNVDAAFRYNTYVLNGGEVVAGIPRREEGDSITVADATGKEVKMSKAQVKRVVPSNLSLMPSNFGEVIKLDDFNDLMSYLLAQSTK